MQIRVGMISLGCPKTLVDSEVILGKLDHSQYRVTHSLADCDVALLNTCSFIQDAQKESIGKIFELLELKKEGKLQAVVVMGCLVQRFPEELQKELKEVDAFIGSGDYQKIPEVVQTVTHGKKMVSVGAPGYLSTAVESRVSLTPQHYRYLKISEGCDHICTFCTIPSFRGKHRSRTMDDVVEEAKTLVKQGAREIILTGQDTTFFGRDHGTFLLPELLRRLDGESGAEWIRLLYAYPSCVTRELMETIQKLPTVCKYLDMPLQHASDAMLTAMKRGITKRRTKDLIQQFRDTVPGLAIRTTFIVGFPGETQQDFDELLEFIEQIKFERMGVFAYSQEEGTPAGVMENQVAEKMKQRRVAEAMQLQQKIALSENGKWVGRQTQVLIDSAAKKKNQWVGRSYRDAPDVDANVFVNSEKKIVPGDIVAVTIQKVQDYDLVGQV